VKFLRRRQFVIKLRQWADTRIPENVFFRFANAVWASTSGGFRIVSNTLVSLTIRLIVCIGIFVKTELNADLIS